MGLKEIYSQAIKKTERFFWAKQVCTRCGQKFRFPVNRGKLKIKCPACSQEYMFDPNMIQTPAIVSRADRNIKRFIPKKVSADFYGYCCSVLTTVYVIQYILSWQGGNPPSAWYALPYLLFYYFGMAFDLNKRFIKISSYIMIAAFIISASFPAQPAIPEEFIDPATTIDV